MRASACWRKPNAGVFRSPTGCDDGILSRSFSARIVSAAARPPYPANQAAKAPVILDYMRRAIAEVRCQKTEPTFAELFCADAYYSFMAAKMGIGHCDAFDNDKDGHLREAFEVRRLLGAEQRVTLHNIDVHDIDPAFRASIVLNAGGLYHVFHPLEVLDLSYQNGHALAHRPNCCLSGK